MKLLEPRRWPSDEAKALQLCSDGWSRGAAQLLFCFVQLASCLVVLPKWFWFMHTEADWCFGCPFGVAVALAPCLLLSSFPPPFFSPSFFFFSFSSFLSFLPFCGPEYEKFTGEGKVFVLRAAPKLVHCGQKSSKIRDLH